MTTFYEIINFLSRHFPSFRYSIIYVEGKTAGSHKVKKEWPRALVNFYRWDLERKNQLDASLDIALYMKIIEELEKMKAI